MVSRNRFFARAGLLIAAVFLCGWWWIAINAWRMGATYTHRNYWNADVDLTTVFVLLVVCTPTWFWGVYRYWNWDGSR